MNQKPGQPITDQIPQQVSQKMPHQMSQEWFWQQLIVHQGETFHTFRGLTFSYQIRGGELFVDRKDKSITRATVMMAFRRALALQREAGCVSGPKKLGTFGASYLYPVFLKLGICTGKAYGKCNCSADQST